MFSAPIWFSPDNFSWSEATLNRADNLQYRHTARSDFLLSPTTASDLHSAFPGQGVAEIPGLSCKGDKHALPIERGEIEIDRVT